MSSSKGTRETSTHALYTKEREVRWYGIDGVVDTSSAQCKTDQSLHFVVYTHCY